ncbi:hypothetical protein [Cumulibacter manganitolerans]|uniref:hypothetical protein n=1 Tax=Cumulibacter manganitolerans TaxID=1884992 RepID=UPI001294E1C4|nr:hypothetical protein [Cumulibacter manganitolerans]
MSTATARGDLQAHQEPVSLPVAEIASRLRDMLGATLVAYLGEVKETRAVAQWAAGNRVPSNAIATRLRTAYQAAALLRAKDSACVVQAWFQGTNPQLGDVAPARLLREQPLKEAGRAVIAAARAFAAEG